MSSSSFADHCRGIAQRFLLSAIVVDDEPTVTMANSVHGGLITPRIAATRERTRDQESTGATPRPLSIAPLTQGFARLGMVCGVVPPGKDQSGSDILAHVAARADIVVLDWKLDAESGESALALLERIVREAAPFRIRLIAIYTAEPDLQQIRDKIRDQLNGTHESHQARPVNGTSLAIDFGACRIVMYNKNGAQTEAPGCVVAEEDLADRLVADFSQMAEGLLPVLVLAALTAVRENVYQLLNCFGHQLDPAFLAHRACLDQPAESELHIVEQIASELQGIMEDAIVSNSPAGIQAINLWADGRFKNDELRFGANNIVSTLPRVLEMLTKGLENINGRPVSPKKHNLLSRGFADSGEDRTDLDRHLASLMSFRQIVEGASRQLSMGTVIQPTATNDMGFLLCVTPKCDSVRLKEKSSFLFLPLVPAKKRTTQVVVPIRDSGHRRLTISMNPSTWQQVCFEPDPERECVSAHPNDSEFHFRAADGRTFRWVGELKSEFAQSVAQEIAGRMSRVALNKSEWLRRSER